MGINRFFCVLRLVKGCSPRNTGRQPRDWQTNPGDQSSANVVRRVETHAYRFYDPGCPVVSFSCFSRNQVMYDGIRGGGSYWYSIFFVSCVGLGQFVVLNLFLAVLLGNIDMIVSSSRSLHRNAYVWRYPPHYVVLITRNRMFSAPTHASTFLRRGRHCLFSR